VKHLLRLLAVFVLLGAFQLPAQTLLYYWHFNNFTGLSGAVDPSTIAPLPADFAVQASSIVKMAYKTLPGVGPNYKTYWDAFTGCDTNDRLGNLAGNCLRLRNPSDSMQLVMNIPSTGYQAITIKYTVQRSSAGNGATIDSFSYSLDSGATWKTSGQSITSIPTGVNWSSPVTVTITDPLADNNSRLAFRILFAGTQNTGASGNNRIDNVSVEGNPAPISPIVQIVYTSDQHYGITRPRFHQVSNVNAQPVNQDMIRKMNALPNLTVPNDGGVNAGATVGGIDYLIETGDMANREEGGVQRDSMSWLQFWSDYNDSVRFVGRSGLKPTLLLSPGNHDISNAIGYFPVLVPPTDPTSMVQMFNLMVNPQVPRTNVTYAYATDKVNYSRDIGGVHCEFINFWPDSANRVWMESDLADVPAATPVIIFTHSPPICESKNFTNPNGSHDINGTDKFQNLLVEQLKDGAKTINDSAKIEMQEFADFLKRHTNVKAYFHGHDNANQFYIWTGPNNDVQLHTYRVDSPMKGNVSKADETKLSFQLISIDSIAKTMSVRECLWDPDSTNASAPMAWGQTSTISLAPTSVAPVPTILANGNADTLTVHGTAAVNLTAGLKANDWAGKNAERWIYVTTPVNSVLNGQRVYYEFQNGEWGWSLNPSPAAVLPLADFSGLNVLNVKYLSSGDYMAYFCIDTLVNGVLDNGGIIDSVKFTIDNVCTPEITINGSSSDVTVSSYSQVNVNIGIQSKSWAGTQCDFFVYCDAPWGNRYVFNLVSGQWQSGASYQGVCADISDYPVLGVSGLPVGTYTFSFTIDNHQNGIMDGTQTTASIHLTVQ